jgi:hypothetical protein
MPVGAAEVDPAPVHRDAVMPVAAPASDDIVPGAIASVSPVSRSMPMVLGVLTMLSLGPLLVWDANAGLFSASAHTVFAAVPLTLVAVSYLAYHRIKRASASEFVKATLCAFAFLFWALNQLLPDHPRATLFNDIAIAAFVLDVVLTIVAWPASKPRDASGV